MHALHLIVEYHFEHSYTYNTPTTVYCEVTMYTAPFRQKTYIVQTAGVRNLQDYF
jgi:hypothetical protein